MDSEVVPAAGGRAWITADLLLRFRGVLSDTEVEAVVVRAAAELRGQVPSDALDELLHRLASWRLEEIAASTSRGRGR